MIWKKTGLMAVAVCAIGFAAVPRASAGTEVVEPEYAPAPRYNYTPPRRVYYVPPPPVRIVVFPRWPSAGRGSAPAATATGASTGIAATTGTAIIGADSRAVLTPLGRSARITSMRLPELLMLYVARV